MSETKQIAEMASVVAEELFQYLKWKRKVVEDHSWDCVTPEEHGNKNDHPSDCVLYYRDPYDNEMKYINTDLKSYKKNSITKGQIHSALESLSYATNCAGYNPNWQNLYKPEDSHSVHGMLFVYNHCGEYDGNFDEIIRTINEEKVNHLEDTNKIFICSPKKIVELYSIVMDIQVMIGRGHLPEIDDYCFFHPSEILNKNHFDSVYGEPATIETLSSPWIIIKHAKARIREAGFVIYYMKEGQEVNEFVYLLDALSYYQILNDKGSVCIKLVNNNEFGVLNLYTAIEQYFGDLGYSDERIEELKISLVGGTIAKSQPQFSAIEIGLRK
ncbi:hypothetical protein ABLB84_03505 [Xenorhabdus szentirmaii]|uniref:hypothetical protein n=1 Tax=Xenorhabdus szentirmaii TaxID=290112 RepID=UPI0032B7607C